MAVETALDLGQVPTATGLSAVDWDFAAAETRHLTHSMHPYPAKYIPQIPSALIAALSSPGEVVADVFCGSGTTLVEALRLGRHAVGVDANPLACLITAAKTTILDEVERRRVADAALRLSALAHTITMGATGLFASPQGYRSAAWRPDDDSLAFWFEPHVVEELAEALAWCRSLPTEGGRNLALTAFSAIVVAVSRQDSDTRYVRRHKKIAPGATLRRFLRALDGALSAVADLAACVRRGLRCDVHCANILEEPDIGQVDLVVCSPPYPNAYSYHLYHRTRMLWLGMDQPAFKRDEIGSHRKYSAKGAGGATVDTFRGEMSTVFSWLARHLRNQGYACLVLGDSTIRGERVANTDLVAEVAGCHGFAEVVRYGRHLAATKKAFNPVIGKIHTEQVLILHNGGGVSP